MNRRVEAGKTLLVDGPASVSLISGKVEVFGLLLGNKRKVVVREGKRIPFAVKEKATLDISMGGDANLVEVDGHTIPSSWMDAVAELPDSPDDAFTAMVIGAADSGKTSFCAFLINKLLHRGERVAVLDGDLGQSDVGPPTTISYTLVTKPVTDLFKLRARDACFMGITSPSRVVNQMVQGMISLKRKIMIHNPDFIIINTDGWVEGVDAVNYKLQLIQKTNPNIIFCLKKEEELASLLNNFEGSRKVAVDSPSAIRHRSRVKRRSLRELGYVKYLRNSKVRSMSLKWLKMEGNGWIGLDMNSGGIREAGRIYEVLGMKPLHMAELQDRICLIIGRRQEISSDEIKMVEEITEKEVVVVHKGEEEGLLMALYDGEGKWLGIALLDEIDYRRKVVKIYTPVSEDISKVELGRLKLNENFKETSIFKDENSLSTS